jgi:hypothetical protein
MAFLVLSSAPASIKQDHLQTALQAAAIAFNFSSLKNLSMLLLNVPVFITLYKTKSAHANLWSLYPFC